MEKNGIDMAENIFRMVKNLSADEKLKLISKLTDSLKNTKKEVKDDSWKSYLAHGNLKKVQKK